MRTISYTKAFALTLFATVILSGCGNTEKENTPLATDTTKTNQETTPANTENQEFLGATVTKEDIEKMAFAKGFDSPEYYALLERSVQSAQQQSVEQELYTTKDISVCSKHPNANDVKNCKNGFLYNQATITKDKTLCDKIESEDIKTSCINQVIVQSAELEQKAELCAELSEKGAQEQCANNVNFQIARSTGSAEKCGSITDESIKTMCINEVKIYAEERARQARFEEEQVKLQEIENQESAQAPTPTEEIAPEVGAEETAQ